MNQIETLVDQYVSCWTKYRPGFVGTLEDNDFGCENLQVFRNGISIDSLTHDDLSKLAALLTRELRGQINRDHKFYWSWCASLFSQFPQVSLFQDSEWINAFNTMIQLILAARRRLRVAGSAYSAHELQALGYMNSHMSNLDMDRYLLTGPFSFAVLEGLLRRKNKSYVNTEGAIIQQFSVTDNGISCTYHIGKRVNQLDLAFRLFEQVTTVSRGRPCVGLNEIKSEILKLYPNQDIFELISDWRNNLVHGAKFWEDRVPIILNLVCLLVIDEIDAASYDQKLPELRQIVPLIEKGRQISGITTKWNLYPPDL